jgi:lipoyl(octanoyl) transferase
MISILQLGTIDYATGLRLQQQLVALRKEEKIGDVLLLLEHKPVITLGRNAKTANIVASSELLAQRGVEVFECDRGGDVTFHGPGQLVGYPIFDLRAYAHVGADAPSARSGPAPVRPGDSKIRRDVATHDSLESSHRRHLGAVDFVRGLEEVLIRTCADFRIETKRIPGLTGVWTNHDIRSSSENLSSRAEASPGSKNRSLESKDLLFPATIANHVGTAASAVQRSEASAAPMHTVEAKLAAIGIHISGFVTSHGFALNVNPDLTYFNLIIPCGITSKPVTSMQQQLAHELNLNAVAESISRNFGVVFASQMLWVETLDAFFGHAVAVPAKPPTELRQLP